MSTFRKLLVFVLLTPLIAAGGFCVFSFPPILSLKWAHPVRTMMMWQRLGPVDQRWAPIEEISAALQSAVIAAEDANFYEHRGVDFVEMERSIEKNKQKKRYARGFSTITMQLAKNLYLIPRKSVVRKGLEIAVAFEMELLLSKERILELYLNLVEWSDGVYGAEAAANRYFRKTAAQLGPENAAFLAAILPNPRKWGKWPPGPYVRKRMGTLQVRTGSIAKAKSDSTAQPKTAAKKKPVLPDMPEEGDVPEVSGVPEFQGAEPIPQDL